MSMKRGFLYGAIAASVTLLGTPANALAEPLDMKTGLWETTVHSETHGELPIPDEQLQKMTPKQRAALEKMRNQSRTTVVKGCLTEEKREKGESDFLSGKGGMQCESKLSKHTSTAVAGSRHCKSSSGMEQTIDFDYKIQDREHVTGTMNAVFKNAGKTMTSTGHTSSRWISASCGKTQ
jgi:hypothetical protein